MIAISSASLSLTSTGTIGTSCNPAICEARQRRSPAMISKRSWTPRTGRTTIGWMTPCCLIDEASSPSSASEKLRRGLRGLALRNSIGTLRCARGRSTCAASPPTSPIRLARPRPSRERVSSAIAANSLGFTYATPELEIRLTVEWAKRSVPTDFRDRYWWARRRHLCPPYARLMRPQLALALDHLCRKLQVGFAADAFQIINQHRLAVGRRLGDAHVARDHGVVDLAAHELPHVGDNLVRQIVARVEHGQHDAVDRQVRIECRAHLLHRLQQLRQTFEREELALQG